MFLYNLLRLSITNTCVFQNDHIALEFQKLSSFNPEGFFELQELQANKNFSTT